MESEFARSSIMARVSATRKRFADTGGVGAHQVDLQLANLVAGNADVGQFAHAGGDGVRHAVFRDQRVHHRAGAIDSLAGIGIKQDGTALDRHFPDRFESQIFSVDVQGFQASFRFPVSGFKGNLISPPLREILSEMLGGSCAGFIFASRIMCVVSPSASSSPSLARTSS